MNDMTKGLSILIYHNDIPVVRCTPKYIGLLGMYLHAGPVKFHTHARLDVEFIIDGEKDQRFRMPAIVTSSSRQGLGLTFLCPELSYVNGLHEMLNEFPELNATLPDVQCA